MSTKQIIEQNGIKYEMVQIEGGYARFLIPIEPFKQWEKEIKMLPMNKICEDIKAFLIQRERDEKLIAKADGTRENEIILFANRLSETYCEHVDVKLVKSLISRLTIR